MDRRGVDEAHQPKEYRPRNFRGQGILLFPDDFFLAAAVAPLAEEVLADFAVLTVFVAVAISPRNVSMTLPPT